MWTGALGNEERRRLVRASDRLLSEIEDWRLVDDPESPVPQRWIDAYHAELGGPLAGFATVSDLYDELFRMQGSWLRGGPDEEIPPRRR